LKKRNRRSGRIFKGDRKSSYRNRGISAAKGGPLAATDRIFIAENRDLKGAAISIIRFLFLDNGATLSKCSWI